MTDLSGALRQALAEEFVVGSLAVQQSLGSRDGSVKYLFRLRDGAVVETVYIPEPDRATLCVSTQVGCGLGCVFCATARMGLKRNLTQAEIVDQVLEVQRRCPEDTRISNLVFMGMGEPLANYDATRGALDVITDARSGMGISPRKITVSTVGLLPQMRRLMEETRVNLAISLHSVRDEVRSELMPVNRKYSVDQLLECCRSLPVPRRKRITFEYLLISGLNDLAADAAELAGKLHGIRCKVNLIPFNPHEGSGYRRPPDHVIERFGETLRARGIQANVRRPGAMTFRRPAGSCTMRWTQCGTPSPAAFRPPLPPGEGWGEGAPVPAARYEWQGMGGEGAFVGPSPGLRPPSPRGRGDRFGIGRTHPLPEGEGSSRPRRQYRIPVTE